MRVNDRFVDSQTVRECATGVLLCELVDLVREFRERFGLTEQSVEGAARKVAQEAAELLHHPTDGREADDVLITLIGWWMASGGTVEQQLISAAAKMDINLRRAWDRQEDGTWQHRA